MKKENMMGENELATEMLQDAYKTQRVMAICNAVVIVCIVLAFVWYLNGSEIVDEIYVDNEVNDINDITDSFNIK